MNKTKKKLSALLAMMFIGSALVPFAYAQVASTAVPFLLISPNARASAMGETGVAVADDASAAFWNVAGLGFQRGQEISLTHSNWLPQFQQSDLFYEYANYRIHIPRIAGTVAVSVVYLNLGEFERRSSANDYLGTFRSYEFAVSAAYGTALTRDLSIGLGLRFIHSALSPVGTEQEVGSGKASTISGDLGVLYKPKRFVLPFSRTDIGNRGAVGAALTNGGPSISDIDEAQADPIPTNLRLGLAFDLVKSEFNKLTWTADVNKLLISRTRDKATDKADPFYKAIFKTWSTKSDGSGKSLSDVVREFNFGTGVEYWYSNLIALRAGWFYEDPIMGNRQMLTFGAGIRYDIYGFDFSYISTVGSERSPLDETLRFTLLINWDKGIPDDSQRNPADDSSN